MALLRKAFGVQDAWKQAKHSIHNYHRRKVAGRQHIVANAEFLVNVGIDNPLVDTLISATNENNTGHFRNALGIDLRKQPA